MRPILVATLALIPVLASAQASNSTQGSASLMAKATPPSALGSAPKAAPAPVTVPAMPVHLVIRQISDNENGTETVSSTAPQLLHAVQTQFTPQEIAAGSDVLVHLTVDQYGVPKNLFIAKATNPVVAQKTLAAVSEYRFKPATKNFIAVQADVTVDVKAGQ